MFIQAGRPYLLTKTNSRIRAATGHGLQLCGLTEIEVRDIGIVTFHVIKNLQDHHCIVGWDMLSAKGFNLDENELVWGGISFQHTPYVSSAVCSLSHQPLKLKKLLQKYKDLFGKPGELKLSKLPPMDIITQGAPIGQQPYRAPLLKRALIEQEINKMLALGVIRPSTSSWASPVTMVPKKDGSSRMCLDLRKVNAVTQKTKQPLPFIQDVFDQLGGATTFSTIDMANGYWQVGLTPEAIPKTAFVTHMGLFECLRVCFGLTGAPGHFQACMNQLLSKHIGKRVMVFLDDIVIYSKDPAKHVEDLELVFKDLLAADITLKESKCHFYQSEIDLLGYVISAQGIKAQPSKTSAIKALPPPTDVSSLRRFLGCASYYRQLVPGFAYHGEPLFALTRKGAKWEWGETQQTAFDMLKRELCGDRVMAHPDLNKPYILYTDACDYAIGGILCQEDDEGIERPIQYVSAQLTSTQRRWGTVEKEAFAVVYCLDKLRCYLLGAEFVIYTDHKPLLSLFTKQMNNTKIQRWGILFAEFGAQIKYRPGPNNVRADMLSRIEGGEEVAVIDMSTEWVHLDRQIPQEEFLCHDRLDIQQLKTEQLAEFGKEILAAKEPDSEYLLHQGILYSGARTNRFEAQYPRVVLPSTLRIQVIKRCHDESAHAGTLKTMARVQEGYVWPGMKAEIDKYIKRCPRCRVHIQRQEHTPMGDMPVATSPGQIVGVDLITQLIPSSNGNSHLMVLIDHYSGWIEAYPLKNKTNEAVWERFRNDYIPRHGCMRLLISDQGAEFKGKEWNEWLRGNRIEHIRTTPYNPKGNGKTERGNKSLKEMLRKLIDGQRGCWEEKLGPALWALRTNVSVVTGFSPFFLHHARPGRAPVNDMLNGDPDFNLENRLQSQSQVFKQAAEATRESRKYNKARLQKRANAGEVKTGDHVILKANEPLSLTAKWDYGYVVTRVNGLVVYLMHPESGATLSVHRDKVVLVDPDMAWDEINPRPRRQRFQVYQPLVRKRRDVVRRDSVSSEISNASRVAKQPGVPSADVTSTSSRRGSIPKAVRQRQGNQQDSVFKVPPPPPSATLSPRDSVASRTRSQVKRSASHLQDPQDTSLRTKLARVVIAKRSADHLDPPDQPTKRWHSEQLSLLQFVCCYFAQLGTA